ncbi:MAG: DUF4924 family protein [Bacteroidales bacterium]|nr:DUF4924 family protein [Bacteroidales bacterium]
MIIAQEKRRNNIAEYVIYMWQIEDMIRACRLDMDLIRKNIIEKYEVSPEVRKEIEGWYESLVHMMHESGVTEQGHLPITLNAVKQMEELHQLLLRSPEEQQYKTYYYAARPHIITFQMKSQTPYSNEIQVCLEALYLLLLMRLSKQEVSLATQEAMQTFSRLLALLAQKFKKWENGELDL